MRNSLAAAQWEALWAGDHRPRAHAWLTPEFIAYGAWRREAWRRRGRGADDHRALLGSHQSGALWRTVIEGSAVGQTLLSPDASARWATQARLLLSDWQVDTATLRAEAGQPDYRAFMTWLCDYLERLADERWVDEPVVNAVHDFELAAPGSLTLFDLIDLTPAQRALFGALGRAGWAVESNGPPPVAGRGIRLQAADSQQELVAAACWAAARLRRAPRRCVALVVPDARSRVDELTRVLTEALGGIASPESAARVGLQHGAPLHTRPVVGAALDGIELLSPRGTFVTLSRWLRSPFFHANNAGRQARAAMAEATLRTGIASQLGFLVAYEHGGLRGRLEQEAAEAAAVLAAGWREARTAGRLGTPTKWAGLWSRVLERLGWPTAEGALDDKGLRGWEESLAMFAQLTSVLGEITLLKAIDEFRRLLEREISAPLPRFGVHVFDDVDAVGPGYDGVWALGLTDRQWPKHGQVNPLLPHTLQSGHGMPWAAQGEAATRAHAGLDRLLSRVSEVVCSWPATAHESPQEPSPMILGLEPARERDLAPVGLRSNIGASRRPTVWVDDAAPAFDGQRIEGGAQTLNLQARCPMRAFCETRLHAHALEPFARGLNARAQGIALHRTLELFVREYSSQASMQAGAGASRAAARRFADRALTDLFGAARRPLAALYELERDRIVALIDTFLHEETRRQPFTALKLEERTDVSVGRWTIQCRIDRVDELIDGGLVLIDYKSGRSTASTSGWFSERLTETQLPLYALDVGPALIGITMVVIANEGIAYRGVAAAPERVAAALRPLPDDRSWIEQIGIWRTQIRQLVDEYVGGDTRIYLSDSGHAEGPYAPLTRVCASVAESSGDRARD